METISKEMTDAFKQKWIEEGYPESMLRPCEFFKEPCLYCNDDFYWHKHKFDKTYCPNCGRKVK